MFNTDDMIPISNVQGPIAGPINNELLDYMHTHNDVIVAYDSGNKYVKKSKVTISVSWDIHR